MEELIISEGNRIILGNLIRVYQKECKMTQADLIEGVCSRQVATNMGKGISARDEEIYVELLRKFGLEYNYKHELDSKILQWSFDLRYAFEWYHLDDVKRICEEAMSKLKPYTKFVYELECFKTFEMIHKFYNFDKNIEIESNHFLNVMCLFNNDLCDAAKYVVFIYHYKFHHFGDKNNTRTQEVREQINLSKSIYPVLMLVEASCLIITRKYFEVFRLLDYLEKYYEQNDNYNGLLDTYSCVIFLINNVQEHSLDEYANKIHNLYQNHKQDIDEEKALLLFLNLGKCYYFQDNYKAARECYSQSIKSSRLYYSSFTTLNFLYGELNETIPEEYNIIPKDAFCEDYLLMFHHFYVLKQQKGELSMLRAYLKDKILHKMSKDNFYYRIFSRELEKLLS